MRSEEGDKRSGKKRRREDGEETRRGRGEERRGKIMCNKPSLIIGCLEVLLRCLGLDEERETERVG